MKVMIVSDTHGLLPWFEQALANEGHIDQLIHCGDVIEDAEKIRSMCDCPCAIVAGNSDYYKSLPEMAEFELAGKKIWITHGHKYNVEYGLDTLFYAGKERGADVIMFGHTHKPVIEQSEGVWIVNPGSITLPRTADRKQSYAIMNISPSGEINIEIKYV